jgi:hypothetical protein
MAWFTKLSSSHETLDFCLITSTPSGGLQLFNAQRGFSLGQRIVCCLAGLFCKRVQI